ncbi:MAG: PadR family transcriptional regulator [Candidatus Thermoplasmatota archaeon]|nr:PadR family transcriptional regulator [Candidatus Thermoplasmatota archaeon]
MDVINNKEAALIGLLLEEPMYPYQIEKVVQFRDMRSWTEISMSSIYKVLVHLEEKGLVESRVSISDENKPRKVFSVTGEGRIAMREKVEELVSKPELMKWRMDVGTYNLDILDEKERKISLQRYGSELEVLLKGYRELESYMRGEKCPEWRIAVAVRPQYLLKAEIEWLDEFRKRIGL